MRVAVDFVAFQIVWFACVLGAARGSAWIGSAVALVYAAHHCATCGPRRATTMALVCIGLFGAGVDSLLAATGALRYEAWHDFAPLAPTWIVALWIAFAATLEVSMKWMSKRRAWSVVFGTLGAPLSYLGAERLGALEIAEPRTRSLALVALCWGIAVPTAIGIRARIRRAHGSLRTEADGARPAS